MGKPKNRVAIICKNCGREFEVVLSRKDRAKFCSIECYATWRKKNAPRGKDCFNWKGGKIKKLCDQCGKEFKAKPSKVARFCSTKCYRDWQRKNTPRGEKHHSWVPKVEKTCQRCGKTFEVNPARKDKAKYCSVECSDLSHRTGLRMTKKVCEICEREFEIPLHSAEKQQFCSYKCMGIWRSRVFRGKANSNWQGGGTELICEMCGENFRVSNFIAKHGRRFCSDECKNGWRHAQIPRKICPVCGREFEAIHGHQQKYCSIPCLCVSNIGPRYAFRGKNSSNWKGGKSFEIYPPTFNKEFKQKIRERDNYICAVCRLKGMDIHHTNYNKKDTTAENCITLCRSCHSTTNANRKYWEPALTKLMEARGHATP